MRTLHWLAVLFLTALPAGAMAGETTTDDPCLGSTTREINACYGAKLEDATERMHRYRDEAVQRFLGSGEDAVALGIRHSQAAFEAYRDIECGTVFENWKQGTIRTVMQLTCSIALIEERTHVIWANWLTYADSSPPLLPEPKPAG